LTRQSESLLPNEKKLFSWFLSGLNGTRNDANGSCKARARNYNTKIAVLSKNPRGELTQILSGPIIINRFGVRFGVRLTNAN
jgi:hypothetical protein